MIITLYTLYILKEVMEKQEEIQAIEQSLSNEELCTHEFNKLLHKFIGSYDLSIRFIYKDKKVYEIIRNNNNFDTHNKDLSE